MYKAMKPQYLDSDFYGYLNRTKMEKLQKQVLKTP